MSGGRSCKCAERFEPIEPAEGANRPGRLWRVTSYRCNHSTFHGGYQASEYSGVVCLRCGNCWRTKASYADRLKSRSDSEFNVAPGCGDIYTTYMADAGRSEFMQDERDER